MEDWDADLPPCNFVTTLASPGACYRGPKPQKCPKSLGEGAKGLLGLWRQSPLALVQKRVAPVQNRVWVVQKTLGRPLLLGSKTPFAPSPNHFGHFGVSGPCSRHLGSQDHSLPCRKKKAVLSPCNFATAHLTACILNFYLP